MSLKPCPFCGAQALLAEYQGKLGYDEFFSLGCSYDGCCAHEMFSHWKLEDGQRDEAIELWNARAPQPEALAPDGFAVVLDDSSSPRGYWFAYAYIDEATAIKAAGMTKGRVVPIYFNALAAPSSEHRLSKTEEAASRPAEGIINGIPSSEDPLSLQ